MPSKTKAKEFVKKWANRGDEKQDTSHFWLELLQEVYGDQDVHNDTHISFEVRADKQNKSGKDYKDVVINRRSNNATLIEQKSYDIALDHKGKQSNGELLTPFEQAKKYDNNSAVDDKARWIITCNFQEFWIYDMTKTGTDLYAPKVIKLEDLPSKIEWLDFLLPNYSEDNPQFIEEAQVSFKAGELVGKMYDALLKRYTNPESKETQKELNKLCVRLVFCMYADDAGLFDKNDTNKFENFIKETPIDFLRNNLLLLFETLNTKEENRDPYLNPKLKSFPYVNGGLFAGEVEIPNFDDELKELLVVEECAKFDWSVVSPTIFGAVFESTLNAETRRNGGMHYTSIENIHKVIDPLFLDGLRNELNEALAYSIPSKREKALFEFQDKLASLTFFDPACGSGNFLTETYLSLRRLENEVIRQNQGAWKFGLDLSGSTSLIKVSIQQFYGIEINDFAVAVAKTALWIAESQMFKETEIIFNDNREYFPLKTFDNILEGNALRVDWNKVIDKSKLNYIMGNPPFVSHSHRDEAQKDEMSIIFKDNKHGGRLDYVCAWYKLSCDYIKDTEIKCAFVSTSSICQGEHVGSFWKYLIEKYDIQINFAYKGFEWSNESDNSANVWCVIVGFSALKQRYCRLYTTPSEYKEVANISPYLIDGKTIFIKDRVTEPPKDKMRMLEGSKPWDDGNLILSSDEKEKLIEMYPTLANVIKKFIGGKELLNGEYRYCLWFDGINITEFSKIHEIKNRLHNIQEIRSKAKATAKYVDYPYLFVQNRQPVEDYIGIPKMSSSNQKYLILGLIEKETIASDLLLTLPKQDLLTFSFLSSKVHMMWMRAVCGRLGNGLRYAPAIYYNFPFPSLNDDQIKTIKKESQLILDARASFPNSSLADLYNPLTMPPELRKAHEENDKEVMKAYGFDKDMAEPEIVAELFKRYESLVKQAEKIN